MKQYLNEVDSKDEMVRIHAESYELICMGFMHGNLEMPDNVVPLSKALQRIEEFAKEVTERWELDGRMLHFNVRACKDDFLLFSYLDGKIWEDYREEERPKNPEKVYFVMRDGGGEEPRTVSETKEAYAEFAIRDMEKMFVSFDIEKTRRSWKNPNLQRENIYFDVYKYGPRWEYGYLYSYKAGKKFIRPLTKKEQEVEREWQERCKKVLLKVMIDGQNSPKQHAEHEVEADMVMLYMIRYAEVAEKKQKEAEQQGKVFDPELIYFETYDAETGAYLKTYKISEGKITEVVPKSWDSLSFMKKK